MVAAAAELEERSGKRAAEAERHTGEAERRRAELVARTEERLEPRTAAPVVRRSPVAAGVAEECTEERR